MNNEKYEVEDERICSILKDMGLMLGRNMPPGYGFSLFIFNLSSQETTIYYISSAQRADMRMALREFLRKEAK
jgi:hypothetical protein